jgi:hypothetical protein
MLRIMALVFIAYGIFELFLRNFRGNLASRDAGQQSVRARVQRLKVAVPAYIVVLAGLFLLVASFVI